MLKCLIVDDEPLARQLLVSYVDQLPDLSCVGTCSNAAEAFTALHRVDVDILFLDIQMPGVTGLSFLKSLKTPPKVVFTTAYTDYAVDAFELEAADYLVKPITFDRFMKAVQKVVANGANPIFTEQLPENPYIFLKVNKRLVKVKHAELVNAESLGDYVKVHTTNESLVTYITLNKLESLLPPSHFVRIHRSHLINLDYLEFIEGNFVRIRLQDIPIGLTYRDNLLQKLKTEE